MANVFHHPLDRGLHRRFFQGRFGLHLRFIVTTTEPESLNPNLKSVLLPLTRTAVCGDEIVAALASGRESKGLLDGGAQIGAGAPLRSESVLSADAFSLQ
jgi:hypothetical protein